MLHDFFRRLRDHLRPAARPSPEADEAPPPNPQHSTRTHPHTLTPTHPHTHTPDLSPLVLAYLGDAVWELYVRLHLVRCEGKRRDLSRASTARVSAVSQARILAALEPELSDAERDLVRRGRNANIGQVPKSAALSEYRRATAFECLLGHLLVTGQDDRLMELLERAAAMGTDPADLEGE